MGNSKLDDLAKAHNMTVEDMLAEATFDSVAKGICTNPGCDYTRNVEPDQSEGYCEECGTTTVSSCLVLAGLI